MLVKIIKKDDEKMENNNQQVNEILAKTMNANDKFLEIIAKAQENKQKATVYIDKQQYVPKVAEGQYIAVTTNAKLEQNTKTKFGLNDCVKVTYSLIVPNEMSPVEITMTYWKTASPTSLYVNQLSILLSSDSRMGFSISDLIGKQCQVTIKHNHMEDGRIFANVDQLALINLQSNTMNAIQF